MKEGMTSAGTVRTQALVLLVLAFLAGAFAGGAIERLSVRRRPTGSSRIGGSRRGPGFDGLRAGNLPSSFDRIGLSEDQRLRIDSIVSKRSARTDSLMKMSRAAYDSTRNEIDAVLTVPQRLTLDSLRREARAAGGLGGRGPRRDAPAPDAQKKP
jgi:hypothetical protein